MKIKPIVLTWLPLAIAITLLSGLIMIAVQQSYRMSANDPQIEFSENIAKGFKDAATAADVLPQEKVDPTTSLSSFGIIYDKDGKVLASSITIDNKTPEIPKGVLDSTAKTGQDRLTWQPKKGIRIATVVTKADAGYVLIGRSLKETEKREDNLSLIVLIGWLVTLALSLAALAAPALWASKKTKTTL